MKTKTKTQADRQLIKKLLDFDPIDWARYPDGSLSFLNPRGQKFRLSQEQLDEHERNTSIPKKSAAKKSKPSAGAAAK